MQKLSMDDLGRVDIATFKAQKKFPIVLVLDNIRSMHNVGSAFRTSDALNIERIILCGITAKPPHREIEKTALGATSTVSWEYFDSILVAIEKLKNEGIKVISVEQVENSTPLNNFRPEEGKKMAFVFGNEVHGVEQEAIEKSDYCVEIPQFGTKHSFNVSVSMGIVLWDTISKLQLTEK